MDTLTPPERSARMAAVRSRDSKPELLVRRLAHAMGFRFRLHDRRLPGAPDLVFPRLRRAIFVHGCFWHRHPDSDCKLARMPKSRLDFWGPKLQGNRERDLRQQAELKALGWDFLVVWECEVRHREQLKNTLFAFLNEEARDESC
jgi:DNA mismatch endonuclease (patch repair protein)